MSPVVDVFFPIFIDTFQHILNYRGVAFLVILLGTGCTFALAALAALALATLAGFSGLGVRGAFGLDLFRAVASLPSFGARGVNQTCAISGRLKLKTPNTRPRLPHLERQRYNVKSDM